MRGVFRKNEGWVDGVGWGGDAAATRYANGHIALTIEYHTADNLLAEHWHIPDAQRQPENFRPCMLG